MRKLNNASNQKALEYAMYMMIGSYFEKTECISPIYEKSLQLYYTDVKYREQYRMEDAVLLFTKKVLFREVPEKLWKRKVNVQFTREKNGIPAVEFSSYDFTLRVTGSYAGSKRAEFHHSLWIRTKTGWCLKNKSLSA